MSTLAKLEEIKTIPASITFDFESVKALVTAHLERFANIVVTEDTVKDGKDLIKEINTTRKALEAARKEEAKKASEPIKAFEANIKELVSLHDTLLDSLRVQIAKFEDEQKEKIRLALIAFQKQEWSAQGVRDDFKKSQIDHLILLGSFTKGGKLTTGAQAEIKQLVSNDKSLQQQTDLRLSQLEANCYKAGLAAPLNESHVKHFLFDDEVSYQAKLNALMAGEMEREKQAVEFRKAQEMKAQQEPAHQAAMKEQAGQQAATEPVVQPEQPTQQAEQAAQSGKVTINVVFELSVGEHISNEIILSQLDKKLKSAGFTTHKFNSIERG